MINIIILKIFVIEEKKFVNTFKTHKINYYILLYK